MLNEGGSPRLSRFEKFSELARRSLIRAQKEPTIREIELRGIEEEAKARRLGELQAEAQFKKANKGKSKNSTGE